MAHARTAPHKYHAASLQMQTAAAININERNKHNSFFSSVFFFFLSGALAIKDSMAVSAASGYDGRGLETENPCMRYVE